MTLRADPWKPKLEPSRVGTSSWNLSEFRSRKFWSWNFCMRMAGEGNQDVQVPTLRLPPHCKAYPKLPCSSYEGTSPKPALTPSLIRKPSPTPHHSCQASFPGCGSGSLGSVMVQTSALLHDGSDNSRPAILLWVGTSLLAAEAEVSAHSWKSDMTNNIIPRHLNQYMIFNPYTYTLSNLLESLYRILTTVTLTSNAKAVNVWIAASKVGLRSHLAWDSCFDS